MTDRKDGGPAFPMDGPHAMNESPAIASRGMSLRDWFAGQALIAVLRSSPKIEAEEIVKYAAKTAYSFADAMLKEREK